jgi:hypothetical protein
MTVDAPMPFILFTFVIYLLMLSATKTVVLNDLFTVLFNIWNLGIFSTECIDFVSQNQ